MKNRNLFKKPLNEYLLDQEDLNQEESTANSTHLSDLSSNEFTSLTTTPALFISDPTLMAFLDALGISKNELNAQAIALPVLQRFWQIEFSYWKTWRWININYALEKLLHYPVIRRSDLALQPFKKEMTEDIQTSLLQQDIALEEIVLEEKFVDEKNCFIHPDALKEKSPLDNSHIWLEGRGLPLRNESALRWTYVGSGFREGTLFVTDQGIKLSLLALLLYQIIEKTKEEGLQAILNYIKTIFTFSNDSDNNSFIGIFQQLNSNTGRYISFVLLVPFVWGAINAALESRHAHLISEEEFQEMINKIETYLQETKTNLWWHDTLRWILPGHTLNTISRLEKLIRFEGRLTNDQRYKAFLILCELAEKRGGLTHMTAIHALAKLAHSQAFNQFDLLQENYSHETVLQFFAIKARAFEIIDRAAPDLLHAWETGGFASVIQSLYAHYTKWTLADSNSTPMALSMFAVKTVNIALALLILKTIFSTLIEYLNCPNAYQRGFTLAGGLQSWATQNTPTCFAEYIRLFNAIPGQPAINLTSIMPNFDLRNFTVLNLSNKGLYGDVVAQILQAMWNLNVPLQTVNLSGNEINYPEDFDVLLPELIPIKILDLSFNNLGSNAIRQQGLIRFSQGMPLLSKLTFLNLANNAIGSLDGADPTATQALGAGLRYLTRLQTLDLSGNKIGSGDNSYFNGTQAIGNKLTALVNLQVLNLSGNQIGSGDSSNPQGTQAIGNGLAALTNLKILNLSGNKIGSGDNTYYQGTQAIGNGFTALTKLYYLDLSGNQIGVGDNTYYNGTQAIGNGLVGLVNLQYLDLSGNFIGSRDFPGYQGTQAIGNGFVGLMNLQTLDLSGNQIGSVDSSNPQGTQAIGNGLVGLVNLQTLDLSGNQIGVGDNIYYNGTQAIGNGLTGLVNLQSLDLSTNWIGYNDNTYYQGTQAIGYGIATLKNLFSLNLSNNKIGTNAVFNGTFALAQALPFLTRLNTLTILPQANVDNTRLLMNAVRALPSSIISNLPIMLYQEEVGSYFQQHISTSTTQLNWSGKLQGLPVETWQAIAGNFSLCTQVTSLNLSSNAIGNSDDSDPSGTIALGNGLTILVNLQSLDLSENQIGSGDTVYYQGTQAVGNGLTTLSKLHYLDLSGNQIGYNDNTYYQGTQAIGNGLAGLVNLQVLNLSGNWIGYGDNIYYQGTQAIGNGLAALTKLYSLDLSGNQIGSGDNIYFNGTQTIGKGLTALINLQALDLSGNQIGSGDNFYFNGTQAIANGIKTLTKLYSLNLSGNYIDQYNSNFTQSVGQALPALSYLRILNLAGPPQQAPFLGGPPPSTGFIGSTDNLGVLSLAQGLKNKTQLCEVNLDQNSIGATGPAGTAAILNTIATLTQLQIIGLSNLQSVTSWSEAAAALAASTGRQLQSVCEANRCTGAPVNRTVPSCSLTPSPAPVPSAGSRLEPPFFIRYPAYLLESLLFYAAGYSSSRQHPPRWMLPVDLNTHEAMTDAMTCHANTENQLICFNEEKQTIRVVNIFDGSAQDITHDYYSPENCDAIQVNEKNGIRCVGEHTAFVEFPADKNENIFSAANTVLSSDTIDMLTTASVAALGAATCVLLPDAVNQGLQTVGCTKTTGETVKEEIQHLIEFISFTSTLGIASNLIAEATHYLCQQLGSNANTANTVSSAAKTTAIVVGTLFETPAALPTLALSTAASFGAAYAANSIKSWFGGFWSEPKSTTEEELIAPQSALYH